MNSIRFAKMIFLISLLCPSTAFSQQGLSPTAMKLTASEFVAGFNKPMHLVFPPGNESKFLVFESDGKIFWVDKNTKSRTLFYGLAQSPKIVIVLDAVVHPDYEKNGRLFVAFIEKLNESVDYVIQEYAPNEVNGLSLYKEIIRLKPTSKKEKTCSLAFDSLGNLLVALPDGADDFDPKEQAQDRDLLWGKVLRFEINQAEYIAPLDNPFVMEKTGKKEIYAMGFREPADMFYDSLSKQVWISDRGADTFQELNILKSGANYGWSKFEGAQCLRMQMECSGFNNEAPIFQYPFKQGKKIVISSYQSKKSPNLDGYLLVHDAESGNTWAIKLNSESRIDKVAVTLSDMKLRFDSFASDRQGEFYAVSMSQGAVFNVGIDLTAN